MVDEVLDWTFAEAPADDAPASTALIVSKILAPRAPRWGRIENYWPIGRSIRGKVVYWAKHDSADASPLQATTNRKSISRWLAPTLVLVGLLTALGLYAQGVTRAGWGRIEQQVGAAVIYEEAQARAGQVSAVLAAQVHTDGGWMAERKLEASQRQPAPNPALQLHLLPGAPLVSGLTASYIDQAQATVVRSYADAAGHTYQFELVQTYVSAQPGIWLRQPTELADMHTTATWAGARLAVSFPLADQSWMSATLPLIEADLEAACAGGQCPGIVAPLVFTSSLPLAPSQAGQVVLLSPHLAGLPHDDAASQALRAGITARVLDYLHSEN